MLLARASHKLVEEFHRHFAGDESLRLPPVHLYNGRFARWLTHTFNIGAITFGRHVFIKPELTRREPTGRWTAPAWLIAHETTHVLQYEKAGFVGFLISYLRDYWCCLRVQKRWDAAARMEAYHTIKAECAARDAERAYAAWAEKQAGAMTTEDEKNGYSG
jgi:Domain of unknown function (DUF4157)